ncbi:A/G-specific adenine glycosylase [Coraliomargarita parva]|uniref:A/G-specific adenine glycosylase n=1 Tax=Coraliomargarita parva TaxID=3014050 RepID=UPI0022B5B55D|nr:A/G-specific adenine glycosylase [Coraliomargarita parva]
MAAWYAEARRPLPWRTQPSLYRTVVSELMAQQTQIKTMLPYFERWMKRFPDFESLADAPSEAVLKHWEGLGYYSRARNLHQLAKDYVAMDPKPVSAEEWRQLPGIGPYTSAAISSIAHNHPTAVVDGNVVRILARLTNDERVFKNNGEAVKAFTELAEAVLNSENPGDHNQSMMELGATVCLKQKPMCTVCPVFRFCESAARGNQDSLPKIQRKATEQVEIERVWICHEGQVLLHRIPEDAKQLAGQYELPKAFDLGLAPSGKPLATKTRSITHRRIREKIFRLPAEGVTLTSEHQWVPIEAVETITLSGPHRRWIRELLANGNKSA